MRGLEYVPWKSLLLGCLAPLGAKFGECAVSPKRHLNSYPRQISVKPTLFSPSPVEHVKGLALEGRQPAVCSVTGLAT